MEGDTDQFFIPVYDDSESGSEDFERKRRRKNRGLENADGMVDQRGAGP